MSHTNSNTRNHLHTQTYKRTLPMAHSAKMDELSRSDEASCSTDKTLFQIQRETARVSEGSLRDVIADALR